LSPNPTNYVRLNVNSISEKEEKEGSSGAEKKKSVFRPTSGYYARVVGWWTPNSLDNTGKLRPVGITAADYDNEQRNFLERLLWAENSGFSLVANIEVLSRLNYKTPIPLYSATHSSGKDGENFDVDLKDIWFSPLIRVTADTRLSTQVTAQYKREIKTGAISAALRVARVAADQLAPAGKLLTALNQDQSMKEAKVWDEAIGQMLGSSASERRGGTTLIESWKPGDSVVVSLLAPGGSGALMPERFLGSWLFKLEKPRMSLFSSAPCLDMANIEDKCATDVTKAVSPAQVLNETVGADTSLIAALRKKDWYSPALVSLNAKKDGVGQFCQQVIQAADDLGLNGIDAKLLLWAIQTGEPMGANMAANIAKDPQCQGQAKPFTFTLPSTVTVEVAPDTN
jgi:hypothetical protein